MINNKIKPLAIQKFIKLAQQKKDMISFAAGLPDLSVLPLNELRLAYSQILEEKTSSFQYQSPIELLKKKIQKMMFERSVSCKLDEILITSGAQQGIFLSAHLWFRQKAQLMIEEFVYPGFLQIANLFDLNYLTLPSVRGDGLDLNYLEKILKTNKPLPYLYIVCNGHNPLGFTWSEQARKDLAFLAEKYNFIIVEDDPYGYLSFTDETFLPMRAYTKNAVYIGSFSKIIAPAIRVGWMVGEREVIQKLEQLKDMSDLYASNPNHLALNHLLELHALPEIIQPQITLYDKKLKTMMSALDEHLKTPYHFTQPKHGMFIWLELSALSMGQNQEYLIEKSKVLYIPASAFSVKPTIERLAIRLNFTFPSCDEIVNGVKRLSIVLNDLRKDFSLVG